MPRKRLRLRFPEAPPPPPSQHSDWPGSSSSRRPASSPTPTARRHWSPGNTRRLSDWMRGGGRAGSACPAVGKACGRAQREVPGVPLPAGGREVSEPLPPPLPPCRKPRIWRGTAFPAPGSRALPLPALSFLAQVPGAQGPIRRGGCFPFYDSPVPSTFPRSESLSPWFGDFLPERQGSYGTYFQVSGGDAQEKQRNFWPLRERSTLQSRLEQKLGEGNLRNTALGAALNQGKSGSGKTMLIPVFHSCC